MKKILIALLLSLTCTTLLALTPPPARERPSAPPPKPEIQYPNNTTQPVNCFDYYKFGSVYASLETKNYTNISGTKMNFFGAIKNENAYPIVNGKLFVKIMRQNDTYEKTGGQDEVDSYVVKENISIKANSSTPITFDWQIPAYALSGEYQVSTYFLVDNSFNMSGLSFTTDIVGGVAKFAVQGEQKTTVFFDRTKIQLNKNPYYTVAFTPSVTETEPADIILTLTNTTKEIQRVPVALDLYTWDAQNQKNLLKQDIQTFLLNPNSSIEIPYIVTDTAHSVYFLQAKAQYQDTKSEVSVRFGRQNKQEPRINFTTLTTYPLEKDKENTLLTCVHNTNNNDADYGKVITTIYNHKGKQIHQSHYEGKITSAIQGMNYKFTPQANYKDLTIETKIYDKAGAILNESKLTYTCSELSDNCTEPQIVFDTKTISKSLITLLGIILLLILLIFTKKHLKNKNIITSLLLVFVCGVMMVPQVGEAKTQNWGWHFPGALTEPYMYWDQKWAANVWDVSIIERVGDGISYSNLWFGVSYNANIYDSTTGILINESDIINPGQKLDFVFGPFNWYDISWTGTGGTVSTPYGGWVPNADNTLGIEFANIFDPTKQYLIPYGDPGGMLTYPELLGSQVDLQKIHTFKSKYSFATGGIGQFSVNPPELKLEYSNEDLVCDPAVRENTGDAFKVKQTCVVQSTTENKTINPQFIFKNTFGKLYTRIGTAYNNVNNVLYNTRTNPYYPSVQLYDMLLTDISICGAHNIPQCARDFCVDSSDYNVIQNMQSCHSYLRNNPNQEFVAPIDATTIPFTLTVERCAATNTPPTVPSVTLVPATVNVGQNTSIVFTSTDAQNDSITYQIDWGDSVLTAVTSPVVKSWTTAGTKTVKIRALDACGESAWTTKTIVVSALPVLDPLTVTADPTCGSVVLNWNNNTATSYQVFRKEGNGGYVAVSPILPTTTYTDTSIADRHTYTYKIWSQKDTLEKYSNDINATPTCPCLPPRVINTSDGICHDPITATCVPSVSAISPGQSVIWTATNILGATGVYSFSWSGTDSLTGTTNPFSKTYTTVGTKTASVLITSGNQTKTVSCTGSVTVATDLCLNFEGTQTTVPTGFTRDAAGNCICMGPTTGTLTATDCIIAAGASTCNTNLVWNTINPVGISAVTTPVGITVLTANYSTGTPYALTHGARPFYLYNNDIKLSEATATATCIVGTTWNGTICMTNALPMSGTLTAIDCIIAAGASTCNTNLVWNTTNPVGISAVTTPVGLTVLTANDSTGTPYPLAPGPRNFFLYNNAIKLSQATATATCINGTTWNGTICIATTGTLTATDCTIAAGASTCNTTLVWDTQYPVGTSSVGAKPLSTWIGIATVNSGTMSYPVSNGSTPFILEHNGVEKANATATARCINGKTWNGVICTSAPKTFAITDTSVCTNNTLNSYKIGCDGSGQYVGYCQKLFEDIYKLPGNKGVIAGLLGRVQTPFAVTCSLINGGDTKYTNLNCSIELPFGGGTVSLYEGDYDAGGGNSYQTITQLTTLDQDTPEGTIVNRTPWSTTKEFKSLNWSQENIEVAIKCENGGAENDQCTCDGVGGDTFNWSTDELTDITIFTHTFGEGLLIDKTFYVYDNAGNPTSASRSTAEVTVSLGIDNTDPIIDPTRDIIRLGTTNYVYITARDERSGFLGGVLQTSLISRPSCGTSGKPIDTPYPKEITAGPINAPYGNTLYYCVSDAAGNSIQGKYIPGAAPSYDGCFADGTMSPVPTLGGVNDYVALLIDRMESPKYGYSLSDSTRATRNATFRTRLSQNINTYIKNLYDSDEIPSDPIDLNVASAAKLKRLSTLNTNGYYWYANSSDAVKRVTLAGATIRSPKVLLVEGADVQIDGNITYSGTNASLVIIVRKNSMGKGGNIYVNPVVTRISATLIADGALMNGIAGASKNWLIHAYQLTQPLVINGRLSTYNTRGGSLTVLGQLLGNIGTNPGKCFTGTSFNPNCNNTIAASQDLERFRVIEKSTGINQGQRDGVQCTLYVSGSNSNMINVLSSLTY